MKVMKSLTGLGIAAALLVAATAHAQNAEKWVTAWTGAVQGPYPIGNASAQPNLSFAFPSPADGARDQTFRLIVRPDIWGKSARLRLSNAFGKRAVTFDDLHVGLQASGANLVAHTNHKLQINGSASVTIPPGESVWTDPVSLAFVTNPADPLLTGRKLAVSFHVVGDSGPMTWHAKALTTSYLTAQGSGAKAGDEGDAAFPFSTASWYFLDAVDMMEPSSTKLVVAFGDSLTDGTDSTLNGDDRWPDVLSRRLHAAYGAGVSVVNQGIGGNRVIGPAVYTQAQPVPGGPAATQRLVRDVLSLSGVSAVILLEGTNDFGKAGEGTPVVAVQAGMSDLVDRLRANIKGVRVIGATLPPNLGSTNPDHGSAEEDEKCRTYNDVIRVSKLFDGVVDFYNVTVDPQSHMMKPMFIPDSTIGGPGDKLHPNRAGYLAMGNAIDLKMVMGGE